ncbi:Catsper1 [Symbiodinium sp. CCMP2456]|nr:Catsper1 [Symbiodinium sp. CCMP2456]
MSDVTVIKVKPTTEFVILATGGVWDGLREQLAVTTARKVRETRSAEGAWKQGRVPGPLPKRDPQDRIRLSSKTVVRKGVLVRALLEGDDIDLVEAFSRLMLNLHGSSHGAKDYGETGPKKDHASERSREARSELHIVDREPPRPTSFLKSYTDEVLSLQPPDTLLLPMPMKAPSSPPQASAVVSPPMMTPPSSAMSPKSPKSPRWRRFGLAVGSGNLSSGTSVMAAESEQLKKKLITRLVEKGGATLEDFYWQDGCAQRVARSPLFHHATLFMIVLYAVWIAVDADGNPASVLVDAPLEYQIPEHVFCTYFFVEWFIRFLAFQSKRMALRDRWFVFDTVLVSLNVAETWVLTIVLALSHSNADTALGGTSSLRLIRLLRLSRLARTARLLQLVPELMIVVKGMVACLRSVVVTACLLFCTLYVFGVVLKQMAEDSEGGRKYFSSVPQAMYTLLLHSTLLDAPAMVLSELAEIPAILFMLCIFISSLLLLNMLVGIMCEAVRQNFVTETAAVEEKFMTERVSSLLAQFDWEDATITKDRFLAIMDNEKAAEYLQEAGIDVVGLVDLAEYIFQSDLHGYEFNRKLSFNDFMKLLLSLRGGNDVKLKDIIDLRKYMNSHTNMSNSHIAKIEAQLRQIERKLPPLSGHSASTQKAAFREGSGTKEFIDFSNEKVPDPDCQRSGSNFTFDSDTVMFLENGAASLTPGGLGGSAFFPAPSFERSESSSALRRAEALLVDALRGCREAMLQKESLGKDVTRAPRSPFPALRKLDQKKSMQTDSDWRLQDLANADLPGRWLDGRARGGRDPCRHSVSSWLLRLFVLAAFRGSWSAIEVRKMASEQLGGRLPAKPGSNTHFWIVPVPKIPFPKGMSQPAWLAMLEASGCPLPSYGLETDKTRILDVATALHWAQAWSGLWIGEMCYARGGDAHAGLRLILGLQGDPQVDRATEALTAAAAEMDISQQPSSSSSRRSGRAGGSAEYWRYFGFLADTDFDCETETVRYIEEQIRRRREPSSIAEVAANALCASSGKDLMLVGAGWNEQNGFFTAEAQLPKVPSSATGGSGAVPLRLALKFAHSWSTYELTAFLTDGTCDAGGKLRRVPTLYGVWATTPSQHRHLFVLRRAGTLESLA